MPLYSGLKYIPCHLCGADDTRLLYKLPVRPQYRGKFNRDIWDIVRCRQCGLIYTNPQPDRGALEYFYTFDNSVDQGFVQDWFIQCSDMNRVTCLQILRSMGRYLTAGRLLDVGCGPGTFLVEAQKAGFHVEGQEIAPFFIEYCQKQLGLNVHAGELDEHAGELDEHALKPASYDCVTAFDVIEHHPDPRKLLVEMRRLLKPEGLVVVSTHDIGNFFARLYGPKWRHLSAIGHLTYFTRQTLAGLLAKSGFQVLHVGGGHTIDRNDLAERMNFIKQFFRVIILRSLVLFLYAPLARLIPALSRWSISWNGIKLDHHKLMMRAGSQVIMNDNMVILARAI
jgi:2-polyprenyl-3-methyl-5-hydroxy-6-metoxy-1,4-benzoquinol methylase